MEKLKASRFTSFDISLVAALFAIGLLGILTLYSAMRPGDAATIFDGMPDNMVLELLPLLKDRQAARILNGLADNDRKARLSAQLLTGKVQAQP